MKQNEQAHVVQVAKADVADTMSLLRELALATDTLNRRRYELEDVMCRMSAAGVGDACTSSSSSSDCGTGKPAPVPATDALAAVLAQETGVVLVCEGKACTRKGASSEVRGLMQQHYDSTGSNVQLGSCSCLGMCKSATNMSARGATGEERIVTGVALADVQQQTCCERPLASV